MAELMVKGCGKQDLCELAKELGVVIKDEFVIAEIVNAIVKSPSYSKEFSRGLLLNIIEERIEREAEERRREAEQRRRDEEQKIRDFELEKLRLECNLGHIVTKAAVIRDSLDQGKYLLGNRTASLFTEIRADSAINSYMDRTAEEAEDVCEPVGVPDIALPSSEPENSGINLIGLTRKEFFGEQRESEELVPVMTEVFSEINVDACGPLPAAASGNRYIVTPDSTGFSSAVNM